MERPNVKVFWNPPIRELRQLREKAELIRAIRTIHTSDTIWRGIPSAVVASVVNCGAAKLARPGQKEPRFFDFAKLRSKPTMQAKR